MSRFRYSLALTGFWVSLAWGGSARAQGYGYPPGIPPTLAGRMITGVQYDISNQVLAEQRLFHVQARLGRHAAQGNSAAVERDSWRVQVLKHRIAVDDWLIRKNSLLETGYYPCWTF